MPSAYPKQEAGVGIVVIEIGLGSTRVTNNGDNAHPFESVIATV